MIKAASLRRGMESKERKLNDSTSGLVLEMFPNSPVVHRDSFEALFGTDFGWIPTPSICPLRLLFSLRPHLVDIVQFTSPTTGIAAALQFRFSNMTKVADSA